MNSNDRVAVVTGASSGLGTAIAKHLYTEGYSLVLHGRDSDRLHTVAGQFDEPPRVATVVGDVGKAADRQQLIEVAIERFGRIDALVNNAGLFSPQPFLEVTEEDLDQYLNTNLKGTYFLTQAVVPILQKLGGGSIVNIGTVLVGHALGGVPVSAAVSSKGAIHALTVQLAAEFGKDNIRVNTVAPGIIRTPIHARNGIEDADSLAGLHLVDRIGEPEHIAAATAHLLGNDFISGSILNVDGGHVAGHHLG